MVTDIAIRTGLQWWPDCDAELVGYQSSRADHRAGGSGAVLAAIVFSSAQSAYGHYCKGSASVEKMRRALPWVVAGVLIGGTIAARTPAHPLLIFVGGFQLFAALLMVTDVSKLVTLQSLAKGGIALGFFSLVFGGVAAMVGIGGGTLFTPHFKASGIEPKLAIGTSAAIGLPLSLAGALAYGWEGWGVSGDQWAVGYIDIPAALALVLGTLLTVRLGVATAHWLPSRALAGLFALFLIVNGFHFCTQRSDKPRDLERAARLIAAVHESAFGTKRTCRSRKRMSAFGGKADIGWRCRDVRF